MAAPFLIAAFGVSKTATEWARDPRCPVSRNTLKARLATGVWAIEAAITTPGERGQGRRGIPLSDAQTAELRAAAEKVVSGPKVHRHTPAAAPEAAALRDRNALILAALERGTSLSEIARTTGLSGMRISAIRDARRQLA